MEIVRLPALHFEALGTPSLAEALCRSWPSLLLHVEC